jgi:hypothetical protein
VCSNDHFCLLASRPRNAVRTRSLPVDGWILLTWLQGRQHGGLRQRRQKPLGLPKRQAVSTKSKVSHIKNVTWLTNEAESSLSNWQRSRLSMKLQISFPRSQEPPARPYHGSVECIPHLNVLFLEDSFQCCPPLYFCVSQMVSIFHNFRLKFGIHFSSPMPAISRTLQLVSYPKCLLFF